MKFNDITKKIIGEARKPGFPRLRPGMVIGGSGPIRRRVAERPVTISIWFQVEGYDDPEPEEETLANNMEHEIHIIKVIINKVAPGRVTVDNWEWEEYWGTTYFGEFTGTPSDLRKVWSALMKTPEVEITEPDTSGMLDDEITNALDDIGDEDE